MQSQQPPESLSAPSPTSEEDRKPTTADESMKVGGCKDPEENALPHHQASLSSKADVGKSTPPPQEPQPLQQAEAVVSLSLDVAAAAATAARLTESVSPGGSGGGSDHRGSSSADHHASAAASADILVAKMEVEIFAKPKSSAATTAGHAFDQMESVDLPKFVKDHKGTLTFPEKVGRF
jgi:hypothetical protein